MKFLNNLAWVWWWTLLALKLSGVVNWSWWYITVPLDLLAALYLTVTCAFALVGLSVLYCKKNGKNRLLNDLAKRINEE